MGTCGKYLDNTLTWIGQNKLLTLLSILLFAFFVSTISLAAVNNGLKSDIGALRQELYDLEHPTEKPTTITEATSVSTVESTTLITAETTNPASSTTPAPEGGAKQDPLVRIFRSIRYM